MHVVLVWAAIAYSKKLGGLDHKCLFLTVPESGSPWSECQHAWVLKESPLPGLQTGGCLAVTLHGRKSS